MPTGTFEYQTDDERRAIELAIAFVSEMRHLARTAPAGQVLAGCERHALDHGRDLLRATLEQAAQGRIDADEQKGGAPGSARAGAGCASRAATPGTR
jgi:hypothetical protein